MMQKEQYFESNIFFLYFLLCFFYSAKKDARVFMYTKKMYHNKQTACLVD